MTRELRISADGSLALPLDAVTQTFVIFGKRGSGKSNTGVVLAEEMHRAGGQIIVLDPIGAWWGLKSSFDGTGAGLPVYVFGGAHGDVPLEPTAGQDMARVAIDYRIPMVLDMKGWAGAARARFVTAFAIWMLDHNDRTPVHIFIEEADAFIPQRPYKGEEEMLGAMDRLIRWGRQEGIGATPITQRSAKVNKDVTTQAEVLIAHRTIGPQDVEAIKQWIKYHASGDEQQQILSSLPSLPDGTAWVWSPDWLEVLQRVPFRRRETFDSASTPKLGEKRITPKVLADVDLERLRERMAATIEKAKADDPRELRKRIAELERAAKAPHPRSAPEVRAETVERIVEVPVLNGQVSALVDTVMKLAAVTKPLADAAESIRVVAGDILEAIDRVATAPRPAAQPPRRPDPASNAGRSTGAPAGARTAPPPSDARAPAGALPLDGEVRLKAGARRMVSALAQLHPTPLTRVQIATLADVSPTSGTFSDYLSAIRSGGLIEEDGRAIVLSAAGRELVADELGSGAPSSGALLEMWGRKLKAGARRMLGVLHDVHPDGLTRTELGERAEISPASGTFSDYLSALRRNGLLDESQPGVVRAGEALFLGGRR